MTAVACVLYVIGTLVVHVGMYFSDKTIRLDVGAGIIACGAAIQFGSFVILLQQ